MSNIFSKIGHALRIVGVKVAHGFIALVGSDAAHQFADAAVHILKTEAGVLATDAVEYAATLQLPSNDETRNAALAKLRQDTTVRGLVAPTSILNMLIEIAVNAAKGRIAELEKE